MEVFTASGDVYLLKREDKGRIKKMVKNTNGSTIDVYFDGTVLFHEMRSKEPGTRKSVEKVDFDSVFDKVRNHRTLLQKEYNLVPIHEKKEVYSDEEIDLENNC